MRVPTINPYSGWWVHAGLFVCALIVVGSSSYIFGLFVVPIGTEFDISRATINNGFIALLLGVGLLSPLVGNLLDKYSARLVIFSGGVIFSFGLAIIAFTDSRLMMLAAILGPVSFGYTACGSLAANTIIVRWFKRRRGTALGIMAVSTSAGGFIFVTFTAMMIETFSWRVALFINAGIAIGVISLVSLILIRNYPRGNEPGYSSEFNLVKKRGGDCIGRRS